MSEASPQSASSRGGDPKLSTRQTDWKPKLCVLLVEDPAAIYDPGIAPAAEKFYSEVIGLVRAQGFQVEILQGRETLDQRAGLWLVHGGARKRIPLHKPYNTDVVYLRTKASEVSFPDALTQARSPSSYILAEAGRRDLATLRAAEIGDWEETKWRVRTPEVMARAVRPVRRTQ